MEAVLRDADVAEVAARGALGVRRAHALRAEALGLEREMRLDLLLEVALRAAAEHQALSGVGSGPRTRTMDSTRAFHRPVSTTSCLRPTAVSE
jgi:hypothetical protein